MPEKKAGARGPWIWGLPALAVIAAILATGFVWPGWFRGKGRELNEPEKVVDSYFQAMARSDTAAMLDLFSQEDLKAAMRLRGISEPGQLQQMIAENLKENFPRGDLRISGLEYESTIEGEEARVRVIRGKATYTDSSGNKVTETPESGSSVFIPNEFRLVREEGRWAITMT